jgi:hypothetical protein
MSVQVYEYDKALYVCSVQLSFVRLFLSACLVHILDDLTPVMELVTIQVSIGGPVIIIKVSMLWYYSDGQAPVH